MSAISEPDLLRIAAVGSVDDGKSTLIGRLLMDTFQVPQDQLEAVRRYSASRGDEYLDLSLITDGLRAEREQGITIDVAYRYFSTPRRIFVMADCPGHISYTRNMVTGSSHADCVILLIDARQGMTEQTKRHAFIASLLRVPHFIVCVNKMDLVGYQEDVYERLRAEYSDFATKLGVTDVEFIPVSALHGDNVVERSSHMPWYQGPSLLYHLENLHIASDRDLVNLRFPVQYVMRPQSANLHDYRAYCGRVAGGILRPGEEVVVLPGGTRTRVEAVEDHSGALEEAFPPMNVRLRLADDLEIARGYMVARPQNLPTVSIEVEAMVCGVSETGIEAGRTYALRQTTRTVRAVAAEVRYRVDIGTLHRVPGVTSVGLNEVGRVHIELSAPIFTDAYDRNHETGSFILMDDQSQRTIAAGMIVDRRVSEIEDN